jgi:tetratricopeptide (TPR) repeat protein
MRGVLSTSLLGVSGFLLLSITPPTSFSPETLAQLDPSRPTQSLCGARNSGAALAHALFSAAAVAAPASVAAPPIPLYPSLAGHRFPITVANARARAYLSQGLLLTYGFNHAGAVRSFRLAQRLDPTCALCFWGEALALGPNINAPMEDRDRGSALAALDRALALRNRTSSLEQALIEAMARRYHRDSKADRAALDGSYADAMTAVSARFPTNDDVAVLAAEAIMDTTPWNYWEADRKTPVGRSATAVRLVETVLARTPHHIQAAHLYIHLMENSADPRRAEAIADRLAIVSPQSAGHLIHMPGHIYERTGRYADSIRVNIAAARSDERFIRDTGDRSLVRYGYYPHNIHFIVTSAQMAGDMETALREARRLRAVLDPATSARIAWIQAIDAAPYFAMAQFAEPAVILAMPPPDPRLLYAVGMRFYARAVAEARLKNRMGVARELDALSALRSSSDFADMVAQGVPVPDLLRLADQVARGRLAAAEGRYDDAARLYRAAIAIENQIPYQEPAYWYYPVRQSLGAALYLAQRYDEASDAFRGALIQTPQNGWVLFGLTRSEQAQGHDLEAAAARLAFQRSWRGNPQWLRMERL